MKVIIQTSKETRHIECVSSVQIIEDGKKLIEVTLTEDGEIDIWIVDEANLIKLLDMED